MGLATGLLLLQRLENRRVSPLFFIFNIKPSMLGNHECTNETLSVHRCGGKWVVNDTIFI